MRRVELHQTLTALLDALEPSRHTGVCVLDVAIELPLVTHIQHRNGHMVVSAQPVSSIYQYGIEQVVNTIRITAGNTPMTPLPPGMGIGDDDEREQ